MISRIQNDILKQSGLEGTPKILNAVFLETIFMSKLRDTRSSNSSSFSSTDLKFGSFIAK